MLLQALAATGVEAKDAIFIGDTTFDMQMAQVAGLRSIGVAWGTMVPIACRRRGTAVAKSVDELRTTIHAALRE